MAELKNTLGLFDAFAIGIGAIIGSGIFVVTGVATYFVSAGALVATLSVLLTTLLGLSRISFAMARERDLTQLFTKLDKRATPYYTVLVFGFILTILSLFTNLLQAIALANFGSLLYYLITNYAAFKLERRVYPRIVPVLGIITCTALLLFLTGEAWTIGCIVLLAGSAFYYLMKKRQKTQVFDLKRFHVFTCYVKRIDSIRGHATQKIKYKLFLLHHIQE